MFKLLALKLATLCPLLVVTCLGACSLVQSSSELQSSGSSLLAVTSLATLAALGALTVARGKGRGRKPQAPAVKPPAKPPAKLAPAPDEIYVQNECCYDCGVPSAIAPELFEQGEGACRIKRQPRSAIELRKALRVFRSQDLGCVRYRGQNPRILGVLAQVGCRTHCDRHR